MPTVNELLAEEDARRKWAQVPQIPLPAEYTPIDPVKAAMDAEEKRRAGGGGPAEGVLGAAAHTTNSFLTGFYSKAAETLGLPVELVDQAFRAAGGSLMRNPGDAQKAVKQLFTDLNLINPEKRGNAIAAIGEDAFSGALTAAATLTMAPEMAAIQSTKMLPGIVKELGKFALSKPVTSTAMEMGGAAGAGLAQRIAGEPQPGDSLLTKTGKALAPFAGGFVGSGLGAGAVSAGKAALGAGVDAAKAVGRFIPFSSELGDAIPAFGRFIQRPSGPEFVVLPTRQGGADPVAAQSVAGHNYTQDLQRIEADMNRIVTSVGGARSVEEGNILTRQALDNAERLARAEDSRMWERVAVRARSRANSTLEFIQNDLARRAPGDPSELPQDVIDNIMANATRVQRVRDPATGQVVDQIVPRVVPAEVLMKIRGYTRNTRWTEESGEGGRRAPNQRRIAIMNELETRLLNDVRASLTPAQQARFDEARAFSTELNDVFRRGPVGAILARGNGSGAERVDPTMTLSPSPNNVGSINTVNAKPGFMENVLSAGQAPNLTRAMPPAGPTAVQRAAEDTVRAMFRTVAEADPTKGSAWLTKQGPRIRSLGRVNADLDEAVTGLEGAIAQRNALARSALAKFADPTMDPDTQVRRLFSSPRATADAAQLKAAVASNPTALEGLQGAVLDGILVRATSGSFPDTVGTGISGSRLLRVLDDPRVRDVYMTILDPAQISALRSVAAMAAQVEAGETSKIRGIFTPLGWTASRLAGLAFGRQMDRLLGSQTLAVPSLFGKMFSSAFDRAVANIDPRELAKAAILTPGGRALLVRRAPSTTSELNKTARYVRSFIAGAEGGKQSLSPEGDNQ